MSYETKRTYKIAKWVLCSTYIAELYLEKENTCSLYAITQGTFSNINSTQKGVQELRCAYDSININYVYNTTPTLVSIWNKNVYPLLLCSVYDVSLMFHIQFDRLGYKYHPL